MPTFSIIIPTYNHCDLLQSCIESIVKFIDLSDKEIIVVANGCTDGTIDYLQPLSNTLPLTYIVDKNPLGYPKAVNLGLQVAKGEFVIFLNDDCILLEQNKNDWVHILFQPFVDQQVAVSGVLRSEMFRSFLLFFCVMIRKSIFDKVGMLDEGFTPGYGEDVDFCARVQDAGFKIVQVPDEKPMEVVDNLGISNFPLYHKAEGTVHDEKSKIKEVFGLSWNEVTSRNTEILRMRYNKSVDYIDILKPQDSQLYETIIDINEYAIDESEIKGKTIIDVGANIGFFSAACLRYAPKKIYAIEPVPATFAKLEGLFKNEPKVLLMRNAVLHEHGKVVYLSDDSTGSRIVDTINKNVASSITLQDIIKNETGNDLILKLDCEGAEFPIIFNASRELLRRFEYIHVETHDLPKTNNDVIATKTTECIIGHSPQKLVEHIESLGYEMVYCQSYTTWMNWPDGTKSDFKEAPTKVWKFKRTEEIDCSIVIPTWNNCDRLLRPCIESLIQYTDLSNSEVIVVANGCTDNTREYVTNLGKPFKLIWIDEQLGYTKPTNIGIKAAKGKFVLLLNNDVVLLPQAKNDWLNRLKAPFADPQMGMTGPMMFKGVEGVSNDFMMFCCALTTREVLNKVGLLDENFSPGGVEDVDYGLRLMIAGYKMKQVPDDRTPDTTLSLSDFPFYHPGGTSVRSYPNWDAVLMKNNNYLKSKFPQYFKGIDWIENEKDYRVFDCFPFFNELDLLEIRLNELYDVVDKFIITESTLTHSGLPKPLYLKDNMDRFAKYKDKIILYTSEFVHRDNGAGCSLNDAAYGNVWARERQQRNDAMILLRAVARDQDYIIVSDADEIPSVSAIKDHIGRNTDNVGILKQDRFMYYLNYKNVSTDEPQSNSRIVRYRTLKTTDLSGVRYWDKQTDHPFHLINNGGWHFTFMGGAESVKQKIQSFAHQEYNRKEKLEQVEHLIENGDDVYSAKTEWKYVEVDESFPKLVKQNKKEYTEKKWIKAIQEAASKALPAYDVHKVYEKQEVTVEISTKDRYYTTLPLVITAIANQTFKPKYLVIYDDGEQKDLRNDSLYFNILHMLLQKGIQWYVLPGQRRGQAINHHHALQNAKTPLIWRVDDDDVPEPDVLEKLVKLISMPVPISTNHPGIGAVSSLVLLPHSNVDPCNTGSGKIEDIDSSSNVQWNRHTSSQPIEVDHLNNTFLYRKEAAQHGYPLNLSPVDHREETIFTYGIKRAGWRLLVDPTAVTWHLKEPVGGIRSYSHPEWYEQDDKIFKQMLSDWGVNKSGTKLIVLNNGIGDHVAFRNILPEIREKYSGQKITLAVCYPDVFEEDKDIKLISIAEAQSKGPIEQYDVYKWGWEHNWQTSIVDAFRKMYL